MNFLARQDLSDSAFNSEEEQRHHSYYQPISQYASCEIELDCIDCHSYRDVMGDGDHARKMGVVEIRCATCHGTIDRLPESMAVTDENDYLFTLARVNSHLALKIGEKLVLSAHRKPLLNIRQEGETVVVVNKVTGRRLPVPLLKGSRCQ